MKKLLLTITNFILIIVFSFFIAACKEESSTLDSLKNEYGIIVEGGEFEEGSTLVSSEITITSKEGIEVLQAIADQKYNKDGNLFIFDIYVIKDDKQIQPNGKVKVIIPLQKVEVDGYIVFHIKSDNSVEKIIPTIDDGNISFETSSFSYFILVEELDCEKEGHEFTEWYPSNEENKHERLCKCGEKEIDDCEYDEGKVTKEATHFEEGIKTYTCKVCGREKEEAIAKTEEHEFTEWYPSNTEDKHERSCNCGAKETADCEYDEGKVTKEATHFEEGIKTYTCKVCGKTKEEAIAKTAGHEFTEWYPSNEENKHERSCNCGEKETADCKYDEGITDEGSEIITYTCIVCGRIKEEVIESNEGIVIQINDVEYPMDFVTYLDGETTSYVYGYVEFYVGDKFVIVDNDNDIVYDFDDLDEAFLWNTWDYQRGNNDEFVMNFDARYGIEFDYNGNKKIHITKAFGPYDGESFGMVFEGMHKDEMLTSMELTTDSEENNEFMWTLNHCTTMNNTDIVEYIGEKGLWFYYTIIDLEAGEKFSLKNFSTDELIGADHLVDITGDITAITREGDLVSVQKSGSFFIIYLPAFNSFTIECYTSNPLEEFYLAAGNKTISVTPDENGDIFYNGFESESYDIIIIYDSRYASLPIILDESMDKTLVTVTNSSGTYFAMPTKGGIYNLRYNVYTNILYVEFVGESDSGGGDSLDEIILYLDDDFITVYPDANGNVVYNDFSVTNETTIVLLNKDYDWLPITLDSSVDASIVAVYSDMVFFKKSGTASIIYNIETGILSITLVDGDGACVEGACIYDDGVVTKEPTHFEEGVKTYTCTLCGKTKEESIAKTSEHSFGKWMPDEVNETKHYKECACGEKETADCTFDDGVVTKEPTHLEEGVKTYTCKVCERTKEEAIGRIGGHSFGDWKPDEASETKHYKECACGEKETADCTFDGGVVTKEPTHLEEGIKIYTCKVCERIKEEAIDRIGGHTFGDWKPDEVNEVKHYKECACGEFESSDCVFDENGTCAVCGRKKSEEPSGIIIVISNGTAAFEGKETVTSDSKLYGANANVYIAEMNDVINVTLNDQDGRTFKYWASANGTIIPDEDFSILVFRSGYYYPVFEDIDDNEYSNRVKIKEGNCEEGILYMSTNSKGDIKYELEFVNNGFHDFYNTEPFNSQYHRQVCLICGETIYEEHIEYDREILKESSHAEEGQIKYECFCGHEWIEYTPITDDHSIDYDDWHIIEESKNGEYGKYRVYCEYCDYYEEYWYLGGQDLIGFMDNKMIHYQYTYGGKVCHDEYYYSYRNAGGQKVYIWALQYEYEYSSNSDYHDTYIFMYIDDEDSATLEPIYISKSGGDRIGEYLWAIYGYAYDVNDWIKTLDSPDYDIGCGSCTTLSNSMSARSSVFESYHNEWAETYNKLRIPTTKEYNDLSDTPWEISYEGKAFQGGYYDENDEYVFTGGRDMISYVKDFGTSYQKYMYVDKETGITYGYEDWGTYYRTIFIMREYKEIVSPEEFEKMDVAAQSVVYSYGDIEKDIKSLCAKRTRFNNFTLELPETITAFRFLFSEYSDFFEVSGSNTSIYYNNAQVYKSGNSITLTWQGEEGVVFDRYEIWDFVKQKWVVFSEDSTYTFNTIDNPRRDAAYVRAIYHKVDIPVEPAETYTITVENGYFEIDGKEYEGTIEVESGTLVYAYANEVDGKTFEYWLDGNGEIFDEYSFYVTSDMILSPVYTDTIYTIYFEGWNYDSYVSVNGGESYHFNEFDGKKGEKVELSTTPDPEYGCDVFIGWYIEHYGKGGLEYKLLNNNQSFTYTITGKEGGFIYAVWTTGENPFIKKYVDIRVVNGFVLALGGEGDIGVALDNAYSAISLSTMGRVSFYDDPTDDIKCNLWDIAYRYELEGEICHETRESFEDEYDFYPAEYWVDDPMYSYPDGEINVTGSVNIIDEPESGVEIIKPVPAE